MVERNELILTENHLVTNHVSLYIGYSKNVISSSMGSMKPGVTTNTYSVLVEYFVYLFKRIAKKGYGIRQIAISFGNVKNELCVKYDLFTDMEKIEKEKKLQESLVQIKKRYGKNAVLKGMNFYDKATQRKRNGLVGGYISWALKYFGGYTRANAKVFSDEMKLKLNTDVYGDSDYVLHVL